MNTSSLFTSVISSTQGLVVVDALYAGKFISPSVLYNFYPSCLPLALRICFVVRYTRIAFVGITFLEKEIFFVPTTYWGLSFYSRGLLDTYQRVAYIHCGPKLLVLTRTISAKYS